MKDIFYRPNLGEERNYNSRGKFDEEVIAPSRDYYSEEEFEDTEVDEVADDSSFDDVIADINRVIQVLEDLPLDLPFPRSLEKMLDDIEDIKRLEEGLEAVEVEGPSTPEPIVASPQSSSVFVPENDMPVISLFPEDNGVTFELEKNLPIDVESKMSFIKDKKDMYRIFVSKLKLMLQQHMREVLYVAMKGQFGSYKDLYLDFLTPTEKIPDHLKHTSDRITKGQIERDQKNRLLEKAFNIEQTIYHMVSNKATFEQRQRYYGIDYMDGTDYLTTKENDELRRMRKEYDKKYESSMYNYYKYLNSSIKITEEILQGFTSEARGKAILKQNGVDPAAGLKEEEKLKADRQKEFTETNKKNKEEADVQLEKAVVQVAAGGKVENYEGSNFTPPMPDGSGGSGAGAGGGTPGTTQQGTASLEANITADIKNRISEIRNNKDLSNGEKIAKMAILCNELRGQKSANKITYLQDGYAAKNKILSKACKTTDCSSFTQGVVIYAMGVNIGGYTKEQVTKNKGGKWYYDASVLQPGDLMYLKYTGTGGYVGHSVTMGNGNKVNVNHVMVYIGDNKVVHCTKSSQTGTNGIEMRELSGWYERYKTTSLVGILRI